MQICTEKAELSQSKLAYVFIFIHSFALFIAVSLSCVYD